MAELWDTVDTVGNEGSECKNNRTFLQRESVRQSVSVTSLLLIVALPPI